MLSKFKDDLRHIAAFGDLGDRSRWLDWANAVSDRLATPFDYLGRTRLSELGGKAIKYTRGKAVEAARDPNVAGIDLYAAPDRFVQLVFDWNLLISWGEVESMLFVGCSAQLCSAEDFTEIVKSITSIMHVSYGFGGVSARDAAPPFYAVGVGDGRSKSDAERDELMRWSSEVIGPRRYQHGMLRDVFPLNFLSEQHLRRSVDGVQLLACLVGDRLPGQLDLLEGGTALWTLNEDEIPEARTKLQEAGLILR